jgi:2,3-bisphosphoglycerate-independent phosphoglycerate mutase
MKSPEHVLMIFVDGLGCGVADPMINPCCFSSHYFRYFKDEHPRRLATAEYILGLDANLDVPGLPQSATGQTALLTGVNAAKALGRHLNGYPNAKLREIISEYSILKWFAKHQHKAAFLNAFHPLFFDHNPYDIIKHLSVTSVTNLVAGLPFFGLDDVRNGKSIYQDISGHALQERGFYVPIYSPEKAGEIIADQSQHYHFSLFEYFQTDKAGHSQDMGRARTVLDILERFLTAVLRDVNHEETLVVLTSDHGNIEDLSFRGHTRNPVMTLFSGAGAEQMMHDVHTILDLYPKILSFFA